MIRLYLFERNVFKAIFFTPLSQQVIRNHISETEKSAEMRFFMKVYTQVGGEIRRSEGKNLGPKGPPHYIQPHPLTLRISRTGVYVPRLPEHLHFQIKSLGCALNE